jgi:hypothetical protein
MQRNSKIDKSNIYIVESPFQLLSAIEARSEMASDFNELIIKYSVGRKKHRSNTQMVSLLKLTNWDKITVVRATYTNFITNLKLLQLIRQYQCENIKYLFIGEIRSWYMRQYSNVLTHDETFALDDGASTIIMQNSIIRNGSYYKVAGLRASFKKYLNYILLFLILGRCWKINTKINLFTCFNTTPSFDKQIIKTHDFKYLRNLFDNKHVMKNCVYFFGGAEDINGLITVKLLFDYLNKVQKYFQHRNIEMVYIPHRSDTKEKLDKIHQEIGCDTLRFDLPAEMAFAKMDYLPSNIASFGSTALYTVSKIYDYRERSIVFEFELQNLAAGHKEDYEALYINYTNNMTSVKLADL